MFADDQLDIMRADHRGFEAYRNRGAIVAGCLAGSD
jgi:hypothetical protein